MTKSEAVPRCAYCRRPITPLPGAGRPRLYCRRAHRQRAYEARRRAASASLGEGLVVVAQEDLDRLHDRLYALETALDDVRGDVAELAGGAVRAAPEVVRRDARGYAAALEHLAAAADDLRGLVVEPVSA